MHNYVNGEEMPLGLGMALAQDREAMDYFAKLSRAQQQDVIERTKSIGSKQDMRDYVRRLAHKEPLN